MRPPTLPWFVVPALAAASLSAQVSLPRPAWIEGRVVEAAGLKPVPRATLVLAFTDAYGRLVFPDRPPILAGEDGRFRIPDLPPGSYYLQALPPRPASQDGSPQSALLPAYYPSASEISSAARLDLSSGQFLRGLTITLPRGPVFRVQGVVSSLPRGVAAPDLTLALIPRGTPVPRGIAAIASLSERNGGNRTAKADGSFGLDNVAPGSYDLVAYSALRRSDAWGRVPVVVRDASLTNVVLPVRGSILVAGSLRRADPQSAFTSGSTGIHLDPLDDGSLAGSQFALVRPSGAFELGTVLPGRYHLQLSGDLPEGAYVSSLRLNEQRQEGEILDLSDVTGLALIEATLARKGASISGRVLDGGKPVPGAAVDLLLEPFSPTGPLRWKTAVSDDEGRFQFRGVAPGSYLLFAWQGPRYNQLPDLRLAREFAPGAVKIDATDGASLAVDVPLLVPGTPRKP